MQLSFDAEKFINIVKYKEAIWNYKNNLYNDKELRRFEWRAVCREMVPNFDEQSPTARHAIVTSFQRQWKILRDGFLRALKNMKKKGPTAKPYLYHNELLFMRGLYEDTDKETVQKPEDSSDAQSDTEAVSNPELAPVVKRRPRIRNFKRRVSNTKEVIETNPPSLVPEESLIEKITQYIENEEKAKQTDNDEDKLFLLSLLSDFKSIPDSLKLEAKFDIINVLRHYRNIGGDSNSPGASSSKRSRTSAAVSTTDNNTTEFCYVKCEEDEFEED